MLGRRRELILIIGGLIGLNILLGWYLGAHWKDYRSRTQWLSQGMAPQRTPASVAGSNLPSQPQSFADIWDRNVFSPLRGTAPVQAQEEVKAPMLPILFGTMDLGSGRFALMAPGDQSPPISKRVLLGDEIGGYKLLSIGSSNVVLAWQEKKITLEITAAAVRGPVVDRTSNVRTAAATPPSASNQVSTVGNDSGNPASSLARTGQPGAAPDVPVGAVVGGKRKVVVPSPFGPLVQWQDVNPTGSQTPQQAGAPNK